MLLCWHPQRILFQLALVCAVTGVVLLITGGVIYNLLSFFVGNGWLDASNPSALGFWQLLTQSYSRQLFLWGGGWTVVSGLFWGLFYYYRRRGV
jgi:hypothetical protein